MVDAEHRHTSWLALRWQGLSVAVIVLGLCHCVTGHSVNNSVRITVEEQRNALLNLRHALGNPHQLSEWIGPGPCVDGQPVWYGITACSKDNLVQSMDLSFVTMTPPAPLLAPSDVADGSHAAQTPQPLVLSTARDPTLQPIQRARHREQAPSPGPSVEVDPIKPTAGKQKKSTMKELRIVATASPIKDSNTIQAACNNTVLGHITELPPSSEDVVHGPCPENKEGNKGKKTPKTVGAPKHVDTQGSNAMGSDIIRGTETTAVGGKNRSRAGERVSAQKKNGSTVDSLRGATGKIKEGAIKKGGGGSSVGKTEDDKFVRNKKREQKGIEKSGNRKRQKRKVAQKGGKLGTAGRAAVKDNEEGAAQTSSSELDGVHDVYSVSVLAGVPSSAIDEPPGPPPPQELSDTGLGPAPEVAPPADSGEIDEMTQSGSFHAEAPSDAAELPPESLDSEEHDKELLDGAAGSDLGPLGAPDAEQVLTLQSNATWTPTESIMPPETVGGRSDPPVESFGAPEFPKQGPICVNNVIAHGDDAGKRCDLCACLDDPTSDVCIREASITCLDGENPQTCSTLSSAFRSLQVEDIQAAAQIFQDRCKGLDDPRADFCSCTKDFKSTECKAGWLQLCETNAESCALAFMAVSGLSQRQAFVDTLIDEGACEMHARVIVFTLELGGISSVDFTPAVNERIRRITAAIAGADLSSVRVAAFGDVKFQSGQRRLLQDRNGVEVIVLIQAESSTEAQIYNSRVEEAREDGLEGEFATAGFDLVSAKVQDMDPRKSTSRSPQEVSALGSPDEDIAKARDKSGLTWWQLLLIIALAIGTAWLCIFWMMISARKRLSEAGTRPEPKPISLCRQLPRRQSQELPSARSKSLSPGRSTNNSSAADISRLRVVPQDEILPSPFPTPRSSCRGSDERRKRSSDTRSQVPPIDSPRLPSPSRVVPPRPPSHSSRLTADLESDQADYEALSVAHKKAMREAAEMMSDWITAFENTPNASEADIYTETFSNMLFDASYGSSEGMKAPSSIKEQNL